MRAVYLGDNLLLAKIASGKLMYLTAQDRSLTPSLITSGRWERHISMLMTRLIRRGHCVLDVGANFGYFSLMGADLVGPKGHVIAVEANPPLSELLFRNLEVNGHQSNSTVHNVAVYSEAGEIQLQVMKAHWGSSSISGTNENAAQWHDSVESVTIPAVTLDDLTADRSVDVMKIDIEGAEGHAFAAADKMMQKSPNIKIIMEFSPSMLGGEQPARELLNRLTGHGLRIHRIGSRGWLKEISIETALESVSGTHADLFLAR